MTGDAPGDDGHSSDTDTSDTAPDPIPDPRVREARPGEAARIRELQSHLRQASPELLEYGLAVGTVLVSVADGRVVGYLLPVDAPTRPGTHLAEMVVDPAFRREGRGRGLMEAAIATRGADGPVTLQTHPENEAALSLYDELGFTVVERREDEYPDGDALFLRLA